MVDISSEELALLDGFEGHPHVYERHPVTVLAAIKQEADILNDDTLEKFDILAYIKVEFEFKVDPMPQYLTAC